MPKTGYVNGSDMLLYVNGKPIGHCSTHTVTINSETKDHQVKPVASKGMTSGLWKGKSVVGLSVSISAEGLCFYQETENGYKSSVALITKGESVAVKCMERDSEKPYMEGNFVVASLDRTDPAQDDSTYSISLENDGEVTFSNDAITETTAPEKPSTDEND